MSEQPPPARAQGGFRGTTAPAYPRTADPVTAEPDPLRPIMFVHVPRMGGTTVKRALQLVFGTQRTLLDVQTFDTGDVDLGGYALIEGHRLASFYRRAFGDDWSSNGFVLLRDPVARVVSQARHMRALPHHRDHLIAVDRTRGLRAERSFTVRAGELP